MLLPVEYSCRHCDQGKLLRVVQYEPGALSYYCDHCRDVRDPMDANVMFTVTWGDIRRYQVFHTRRILFPA